MDFKRMLKTSALVGLASAAIGCSNVRGYVLGSPLTEEAKQAEDIRLRREASRTIVPASDVGSGYFRLETKENKYAPASREKELTTPYRPSQEYKGLIGFSKDF